MTPYLVPLGVGAEILIKLGAGEKLVKSTAGLYQGWRYGRWGGIV